MTTNPLAGGLIEVACRLADTRDGRRIVEQAAFRRAISSSYYAVFHTLCQICCEGLGFWTAPTAQSEPIYRHLEHDKAKDVLASVKAQVLHDDIFRICAALIDLRRSREDADYSQPGRFGSEEKLLSREETRTKIALAEEAVRLLDELPPNVRRTLAVMLTVRSGRR